jgi:hypothetical protein
MATPTTVTAIRPTEFFVFFVPERRATIAPVSGCNVDVGFVNELHGSNSIKAATSKKGPQGGPFHRATQVAQAGMMLTT